MNAEWLERLGAAITAVGGWELLSWLVKRRQTLPDAQMARLCKLIDAQAEKDAEDIRLGRKAPEEIPDIVKFKEVASSLGWANTAKDRETAEYLRALERQEINDAVRKSDNVGKAISNAIVALEDEQVDASESRKHEKQPQPVDVDWLHRWRDCAGRVSSDKMQQLWGQVLAGEIKSPGAFSIRSMDCLSAMSQADAKLIEKLAALRVGDFIWREAQLWDTDITVAQFMDLASIGIIDGTEAITLSATFNLVPTEGVMGIDLIVHDLVMRVKSHVAKTFEFRAVRITSTGKEILSLGKFKANRRYLEKLAQVIVKQNCDVMIGDLSPCGTRIDNMTQVVPAAH